MRLKKVHRLEVCVLEGESLVNIFLCDDFNEQYRQLNLHVLFSFSLTSMNDSLPERTLKI